MIDSLQSLAGLNLAGVTGNINYNYDNAVNVVPYAINGVIAIFALFFLMGVFMFLMKVAYPKSKRYRQLMTDLYVVGKVKQLASEDKIDLYTELKSYIKTVKKLGFTDKDLDKIIEDDLKEKIIESREEREDKKDKKEFKDY